MPLLLILLIATVIIFLIYLRIKIVFNAFSDWQYYVYKYKHYCALNYQSDKPTTEIEKNNANTSEAIMIFLMVWKINPDKFFSYKPDYDEIFENYILNK